MLNVAWANAGSNVFTSLLGAVNSQKLQQDTIGRMKEIILFQIKCPVLADSNYSLVKLSLIGLTASANKYARKYDWRQLLNWVT